MEELRRRLWKSFLAVVVVVTIGTTWLYALGYPNYTVVDCLYQVLVIITTLGIDQLEGLNASKTSYQLFSIVLLCSGITTFLYFASTLTAVILEGDLQDYVRRNRMKKRIEELRDHVIVCGVGTTGRHVVAELHTTGTPFVMIDTTEELLASVAEDLGEPEMLRVVGDATDDDTLQRAGIERCAGLVSCLPDDRDNLFVVVTARDANPDARIVARAVEQRAGRMLRKAGAAAVVSPNYMGGQRLVSEMIRPHVVEFLDEMLLERDKNLRLSEIEIPAGSPTVGKLLRDVPIRARSNALVLAIRNTREGTYQYNPGPNTPMEPGTVLIVLGPVEGMEPLKVGIATGFPE